MTLQTLPPYRDRALIGGEWVSGTATTDIHDPATGAIIAQVPALGAEEADRAIAAAERAQIAWRARPAIERADLLHAWHALILRHKDALAAILTAEQGKPLAEAAGEIAYAASFVRWFAEEARRIDGEIIPAPAPISACLSGKSRSASSPRSLRGISRPPWSRARLRRPLRRAVQSS